MKINAGKIMKNLAGVVMQDASGAEFTIGKAIANILIANHEKPVDHFRIYKLSEKLWKASEIEIEDADMVLIKEMVAACKTYNSLVLGQVLQEFYEAGSNK